MNGSLSIFHIKLLWTLSTNEVTQIWSEINISQELYYVVLRYQLCDHRTLGIYECHHPECSKMPSKTSECDRPVCSKVYQQYISVFTALSLNVYISVQNSHLPSQPICDQILHILIWTLFFTCFRILIWVIFCFFSYVPIVHIIWRRWGVAIHYKLIPC